MRAPIATALSLWLAGSAAAVGAPGQDDVEVLKRQMRALEQRVERLEAELAGTRDAVQAAVPAQPVAGGWRSAHNWQLLERGMESHDVQAILGEPSDTRRISKFEHWIYSDGLLRFYLGRLKSWEPASGIGP